MTLGEGLLDTYTPAATQHVKDNDKHDAECGRPFWGGRGDRRDGEEHTDGRDRVGEAPAFVLADGFISDPTVFGCA